MMKTGLVPAAAILALAAGAHAQFYTGFEQPQYMGSPGGNSFVGVEGWYQPVATGMEHSVYTYAGNALGLTQNPVGGNQFIGGTSGGGALFPRAQLDINFSENVWTAAYDVSANWLGTGNSGPNLGSFSLQHDTVPAGQFRQFIALANFNDPANPLDGWRADFNVFDAAGGAMNGVSPGPFWDSLDVGSWYRQYITFDLSSNRILSIALVNLNTGAAAMANPADWYMTGGAGSTLAIPNGVRFFIGGPAGNTLGWDNLWIIPAPGTGLALLGLGTLVATRRRR